MHSIKRARFGGRERECDRKASFHYFLKRLKWEWMAMQFAGTQLQFRFRFAIVSARTHSSLCPIAHFQPTLKHPHSLKAPRIAVLFLRYANLALQSGSFLNCLMQALSTIHLCHYQKLSIRFLVCNGLRLLSIGLACQSH